MTREPNDAGGDADRYNDEQIERETDPDAERDEWPRHPYNGSLKLDCIAALKQSALQIHSDYCLTHGIPQKSVQDAFKDVFGDGKKEQDCTGFHSMQSQGKPY